jgi:EmrB/QacA subfamily drug resistance transporter
MLWPVAVLQRPAGFTAQAPREGYLLGPRATNLALIGVMLGMLLAALNQTILATAMPRIVADIGGESEYSWAFSGYMLAVAVTTPTFGRLSDVYGRRPFLLAGLCSFLVGALVGAMADSIGQVIAARVIQGAGAGALMPLAFSTIADLVPSADRPRWQGYSGAMFGLASVIGPFGGGWIADTANWRWVFLMSVPVGFVALAMVAVYVRIPPHPQRGTHVDYVGGLLLALGLACTLVAVVRGGEAAPWGSPQIVGAFVTGAVLLAGFVAWERRQDQPLLPIDIFRPRAIRLASFASLLTGSAMFATVVYVPLLMQGALGDSATSSGFVLAPMMLAMVATTAGSGQVIGRTGRYRWALLLGPVLMGAGYLLLGRIDVHSSQLQAALAMIVVGLGIGFVVQNVLLVIQNVAPSRHMGTATSTAQLFRSLGNALGVAVLGSVLVAGLPAGTSLTAVERSHAPQIVDAFAPVFGVCFALMCLELVVLALIPETPLRRGVRDDVEADPAAV